MSAANKSSIKKLGIIAGGGELPAKLLHACDRSGIETFVVGFKKQTSDTIFSGRPHMKTRLGAAGRIINTLKSHNIRDLVLIGGISRPTLAELKPDMRTIQFFAKVGVKALGDDGLLKALRSELESEGFVIHGVQNFVQDLLTPQGAIARHKPGKADFVDIKRGVTVAREIGRLDIGQAVIVQQGVVLGVEGVEGTDELIKRCTGYRKKGAAPILVKLCKPQQDKDLDLPTIGPATILNCANAGLRGIVVQAGMSLLVDPQQVSELADKHKIFVYGLGEKELQDLLS